MALISIHALREEGDWQHLSLIFLQSDFNPRPPRGGRHRFCRADDRHDHQFQSTPSARRATKPLVVVGIAIPISIHALREEGDPTDIYTIANALVFQSTPSARRATQRGGYLIYEKMISIHALREEGDGAG